MDAKILVAEDSTVVFNLTKKVLSTQKFTVDNAKNGKQVLEKIQKKKYDLILLDITMPVMDGISCSKAIREEHKISEKELPIIAITGNALNYESSDFKAAGINDYLTKPLDYNLLIQKIKAYLK